MISSAKEADVGDKASAEGDEMGGCCCDGVLVVGDTSADEAAVVDGEDKDGEDGDAAAAVTLLK